MTRPSLRSQEELFKRDLPKPTLLTGLLAAGDTLGVFAYGLNINYSLDQALDATISALAIAELLHAFGAWKEQRTIWQRGLFSNRRLFLILAVNFALQLALHHAQMLQALFHSVPVWLDRCVVWIRVGFMPLVVG